MNMKELIFLHGKTALLVILLVFIVISSYRNEHSHGLFWQDVRDFIETGGRNTARDGYNLCKQINLLNKEAGKEEPLDCEDIYDKDKDHKIDEEVKLREVSMIENV